MAKLLPPRKAVSSAVYEINSLTKEHNLVPDNSPGVYVETTRIEDRKRGDFQPATFEFVTELRHNLKIGSRFRVTVELIDV